MILDIESKNNKVKNGLYIVSTPIGNLADITLRAIDILKKSDYILCEDTRVSKNLLVKFDINSKLISNHKFNEKKNLLKVIEILKSNQVVSLISDAGTPLISDPGLILVKKCIEENIDIYPVPGASAVTTAVSMSGFSDQYFFYGFLPKKESELESVLKNLSTLDYSIVFFISAKKINFFISKFKKFLFDRKILVGKEMTKIYEEFTRGEVNTINSFPDNLKGELTIVVSEKTNKKINEKIVYESVKIEIKNMLNKYSHKDVVEFISKKENLPKKLIYDFCLQIKKNK